MSTITETTQTPRNARDAYRLIHRTLAESVVSAIDEDFAIEAAIEYADWMADIELKLTDLPSSFGFGSGQAVL